MCELVDVTSYMEIPEVSNDQEELDKKVYLHALSALRAYLDKYVIIKSHSGDFDNKCFTHLINN